MHSKMLFMKSWRWLWSQLQHRLQALTLRRYMKKILFFSLCKTRVTHLYVVLCHVRWAQVCKIVIYMAPPPLQTSCQSVQSPSLCIPLKAPCNCITSPAAVVPCFPLWLTWSRLYKPQWKPPRKTSCHSKWFSLSPLIQLCVSHPKIVPLLLWLEKVAVECAVQ